MCLNGRFHSHRAPAYAAGSLEGRERFLPPVQRAETSHPRGGFVLWVQLPTTGHLRVSTRPMFEQARAEGIGFTPGHLFGRGGAYSGSALASCRRKRPFTALLNVFRKLVDAVEKHLFFLH